MRCLPSAVPPEEVEQRVPGLRAWCSCSQTHQPTNQVVLESPSPPPSLLFRAQGTGTKEEDCDSSSGSRNVGGERQVNKHVGLKKADGQTALAPHHQPPARAPALLAYTTECCATPHPFPQSTAQFISLPPGGASRF